MALPQPTNVPRIIEVLDPGANQLSVEVRMPPQLASKYPDKAWGTAIDTIGLQKKDSDRFVGYVLVDIQPMRDSDDLKWIFEKLSGPVWTTTTVGSENIIPEKFRSQVSQTKTKQEVAPGTAASAITGDLISSTVEAQENTGKAVKVNVSETIDAAATALVSPSLEDQLYVTTEILVAEGTLPDTGTGVVESTVQAIGKGKAIKTSKFAVTAYTNKTTYTVGYASLLNENVGSADSIPAKFRALKSLKTWRLRVQASAPPSTPALGVGSGAYSGYDIVERAVKQTQENGSTDVFELVIVGLANTGANSLDSTTYGKIVTTTTTETLSLTAQTIDTGLAVISSTVEELGNGMTLKSTEQVQGETWPDPVEQEVVSDGTKQPPARYLRDLIRTTVKKMVGAVGSTTLTGNQVAKSYKRETPDRVAETVTTEELNLTLTAIDSSVQQKPFVTITEVMTPGPAKVLPPNRSGSAKLVYENGATNIWENTEEVAVAREGSAGKDKDKKPFVEITTDKRYSTTDTIATASGSANIVFNDGTTQVYEVNEVTSTGRYGAAGAEQQVKPFVKTTSTKTYEPSGVLPGNAVGSSNKVYDDGLTAVYEQSIETSEAREGPAGSDKDVKPFVSIATDKRYSTDPAIATLTGSANVVFNDGAVQIYEVSEVTSTGRYGSAGAEQQAKPFVSITSTATYQDNGDLAAGEVGSTNKVYDDGTTVVYEKKVETAVARETTAGTDKDVKPFVSIATAKKYSADPTVATLTGSANVVFNDGAVQVYEVNEVTSTGRYGAAGTETDQKPFVKLQTVKTYEATDNLVDGQVGTTNKIYDDGTTEVYEKSVVNATAREGLKGIETSAQQWGAIKSTTNYTANSSAPAGGSVQIVFAQGATTVYEQTTTDPTVSGSSQDVDAQQWGKITWSGNYSVSAGGDKSRQVWSNGVTSVFLNETASLSISGSSTDVDPQQWGKITWNGSYSSSSSGDKSRQVYSGPGGSVFLNETASVAISGGSKDIDPQQWGKITWDGSYSSSSSGDKSRQVYSGPGGDVYLNETASVAPSGGSKDVDPQQWGKITWDGSYSSSSSGDKSRQVYSGPGGSVFLNETASVAPSGGSKDVDPQQWGKITWNGSYSSSSSGDKSRQVYSGPGGSVFLNETASVAPSGGTLEKDSAAWGSVTWSGSYSSSSSGDKSRQVYSGPGGNVYLNETASVAPSGGSKEVDPNAWGSITWNGTFANASSGTRSQKVAQVGSTSVYKNETPVLSVAGGSFTSAQEKHPLYTTVETSSFATTSILGQGDSRSKQVFALGAERVFENISRAVTSTGNRTYGTMVKFTAPSVLLSLKRTDLMRRDGGIDAIWNPVIEEGFEGFLPAEVTEKYSDNGGFSGGSVINFGPTPVKIATPFGSVSIGPTLHGVITHSWGLSNDRTYYNNTDQITIPATRYTTWRGVGRVLVGYETQPHLSGFITREIHITL